MKQIDLNRETTKNNSHDIGKTTFIVEAYFHEESDCLYQKIVNLLVCDSDEEI